jgi:hypothetical protein
VREVVEKISGGGSRQINFGKKKNRGNPKEKKEQKSH